MFKEYMSHVSPKYRNRKIMYPQEVIYTQFAKKRL